MATDWHSLNIKEVQELLDARTRKEVYKHKGHSFIHSNFGKQYCSSCGLVALNNPISQWAIDKGCNYKDHTQWENKVKVLTRRDWQ